VGGVSAYARANPDEPEYPVEDLLERVEAVQHEAGGMS
jgi:hypothetical protein